MLHRIVAVDSAVGMSTARAQYHWRERHAPIFSNLPMLLGYVQNRPLPEEWSRLGHRTVCAEMWFADGTAEREAFASRYYEDVVAVDEELFLDRSSAWLGRVLTGPGWRAPARYRVLALGVSSLPIVVPHEVHVVDRDVPGGTVRRVLEASFEDRDAALELARAVGPQAFVTEAFVVLPPPRGQL